MARKSRMRAVFAEALQHAAHIYVPYAVVFETANAIAHIKDDQLRKELTGALVQSVERSLESTDGPWIITRPR